MKKWKYALSLTLAMVLSLAPAALAAGGGTAYTSTQDVEVDGSAVQFQMYALRDANGDTNYVKLRDVAHVLNNTPARFSVGYDSASGSILVTTGASYTDSGTEMTTPFSGDRTYRKGSNPVLVNGKAVSLDAIILTDDSGGDYTYFKLRDLGSALGFQVDWTAARGVIVETGASGGSTTTPTTPATPQAIPLYTNGKLTSTDSHVELLRTSVDDLKLGSGSTYHQSLTQLFVSPQWSKTHGGHTISWQVDDPTVLFLQEKEVNGYPAVTFRSMRVGDAKITATVTCGDGTTAEAYCYVTVIPDETTSATTPTTPSTGTTEEELAAKVVELVNEERTKEGLSPLSTLPTLTAAAHIRAPETARLFEHSRPDGSTCFTALKEAGVSSYRTAGENIAMGSSTAEGVMNQWMNSPGHRANILNKSFTRIGVGCYKSGNTYYWVQMFIG